MTIRILKIIFFVLFGIKLVAQNSSVIINWQEPKEFYLFETEKIYHPFFENARVGSDFLPYYYKEIPIQGNDAEIKITNEKYAVAEMQDFVLEKLGTFVAYNPIFNTGTLKRFNKNFAYVNVLPYRMNKNTGVLEKLISFDIEVKVNNRQIRSDKSNYAANSVLATGSWYKIGVTQNGVYRLNFNDLVQLGLDPQSAPFDRLQIYGNGGRMLPLFNGHFNHNDLVENSIYTFDSNGNNIFDQNDYVLFYGIAPNRWLLSDAQNGIYTHERNVYSDTTYYFITFGNTPGKRIQNKESINATQVNDVDWFDDFHIFETDEVNIIGSGRNWFGERFDAINNSYSFSRTFQNRDISRPINVSARVASRCVNCNITYQLRVNGNPIGDFIGASVSPVYFADYARFAEGSFNVTTNSNNINVTISRLNQIGEGWLDFITINAKRKLIFSGSSLEFRNSTMLTSIDPTRYTLSNIPNPMTIWDISDPLNPRNQQFTTNGGSASFVSQSDSLEVFIAFNNAIQNTPFLLGSIPNQNLHALGYADLLIVSHPKFWEEALRLGKHRETVDGFSFHLINIYDIYNEFSGGSQDPAALRNFVRMFYQRANSQAEMPRYLLLMGDGSYDFKPYLGRIKDANGNNINNNFIPTFQSFNSFSRSGSSFTSDDFFAMVDQNNGVINDNLIPDTLRIGVGRLFVRTLTEAKNVVDKIIHYDLEKNCFGDWRNYLALVADDNELSWEDSFFHVSEELDQLMGNEHPVYNVDKVYLDAFDLEVSAGRRYPEARRALNNRAEKGALLINFIGHGGERGWTSERVLGFEDIRSWKNFNNLPAFATATCTFTRFDDPTFLSAGEEVLLRRDGGGIALFSTVRAISIIPELNRNLFRATFEEVNGEMPRLGDIIMRSKNKNPFATGGIDKFMLFGDPSMMLAYPRYTVVQQSITNATTGNSDTLKATDVITISGIIVNDAGQKMEDFNGIIYPTIFDKPSRLQTKSNNVGANQFEFDLRRSILFKGKASVVDGEFSYSFKIPKDINYIFGEGKISYYANNPVVDAHGYYNDIIIGGFSDDCNDFAGPQIQLFMNNENFVNGGVTNANPVIFAKITDESGINTAGSGIGRDLYAILQGPVNQEFILNNFFEYSLNSFTSGEVRFPLRNLPDGQYTLTLQAWDGCNNFSEEQINFTVNTLSIVIDNLFNFPNPFSDFTTFSFEHNQAGQNLNVTIDIFSLTGTLMHSIKQDFTTDGFRALHITWDGSSSGGGQLTSSMYIYRVTLTNTNTGESAVKSGKLIYEKR